MPVITDEQLKEARACLLREVEEEIGKLLCDLADRVVLDLSYEYWDDNTFPVAELRQALHRDISRAGIEIRLSPKHLFRKLKG